MSFTEGQKQVYNAMFSGQNIFLTGEAGTGKSFVVKEFIDEMRRKHKRILVCAPTGISAINVGGQTIHRAFKLPITGLRPGKSQRVSSAVSQAEIVVIDEISMCRLDVFYVIASILLFSRKKRQVILVGDFFQLPPVLPRREEKFFSELWKSTLDSKYTKEDMKEPFAFMSRLWKEFKFTSFCLTEPIRHKDDIPFLEALNKIRKGDNSGILWINKNASTVPKKGAIYLCGRNDTVFQINQRKLSELSTPEKTYRASITGDIRKSDMPIDETVVLKKGCRIMAVVNDTTNSKFCNGSLGWVKELYDNYIIVDFDNGNKNVCIGTYCWELKEPHIDYIEVTQFRSVTVRNGKRKVSNWTDARENDILPSVSVLQDGTEVLRKITRKIFIEEPYGTVTQIPVKVAYAVTIHKSQGQTYDSAILDPRCFGAGQLYVALSRVRRIRDLCLKSPINWKDLLVSPAVIQFYEQVDKETKVNVALPSYLVTGEEMSLFEDWWKDILEKRKNKDSEAA